MLSGTSTVDVMFTKWDLVESHDDKTSIEEFVNHIQEEFKTLFSHRLGTLRFTRVAAQSSEADLPQGFGLLEIFPSWVKPFSTIHRSRPFLSGGHFASEYDRFRDCVPVTRIRDTA